MEFGLHEASIRYWKSNTVQELTVPMWSCLGGYIGLQDDLRRTARSDDAWEGREHRI